MKLLFRIVTALLVAFSINAVPASAQNAVYVIPYFAESEGVQSNMFVREVKNGNQVTAAELDLCYRFELEGKWDRVVIPLKADGANLTGSGASQIEKTAVIVNFTRKRVERDLLSYDGEIKLAGKSFAFRKYPVTEHNDLDFMDFQSMTKIEENPADFTDVAPHEIAVRFKRGELKTVLEALRGEPVIVKPRSGLVQDCSVLRKGYQTLELTLAPEKAPELLAKLRKLPGVITAGWSGYSHIDHATRLPISDWGIGGKIDRNKIAAELAKSASRALDAKFQSAKWNTQTGELQILLTRPSQRFHEAGFTEEVDVRFFVEPERPGATDYFILWVRSADVTAVDNVPGAGIKLEPFEIIGGEGIYIDMEQLAKAITKDQRGQSWDNDTRKWK